MSGLDDRGPLRVEVIRGQVAGGPTDPLVPLYVVLRRVAGPAGRCTRSTWNGIHRMGLGVAEDVEGALEVVRAFKAPARADQVRRAWSRMERRPGLLVAVCR